jgi:hypothetical protein
MVISQILYDFLLYLDVGIPIYSKICISIFVFAVTFKVCLFKDLKMFIAITSKGAISVIALMAFIIRVGVNAFKNTSF